MERVLDRLAALDPTALPLLGMWVPLWAGILLVAVGLVLAVAGSHRHLRRAVVTLAGAVAGWYLVPASARALGFSVPHASWIGAGALAASGLLKPAVLAVTAGVLGGGLAALSFFPGELLRAALPAAVVGGLVAGLLRRALLSLAAAGLGAGLVLVGATSILLRTPAAGPVTTYPIVPLAAAGLLFICAAAYQLTRPGDGPRFLPVPAKRRAD